MWQTLVCGTAPAGTDFVNVFKETEAGKKPYYWNGSGVPMIAGRKETSSRGRSLAGPTLLALSLAAGVAAGSIALLLACGGEVVRPLGDFIAHFAQGRAGT